jgi:hypothetical protein
VVGDRQQSFLAHAEGLSLRDLRRHRRHADFSAQPRRTPRPPGRGSRSRWRTSSRWW